MAKVVFVQEVYFPFQSTAKLSAYLKQNGHEVNLAIGDEKKVIDRLKKLNPDLIAFSVLTPDRNFMLSTVAAIKKAGIKAPTIAGGYDITFLPQIIEYSDLDIICKGEGEKPLSELCDMIDSKKDYSNIPNLWVKKNGKIHKNQMRIWATNLDEYPFDDRDLYLDYDSYFKIIPFTQVLAGRGCPYPCSYCFNDGYRKLYQEEGSKGYCNLRSVGNVIEELIILKEKYKARYIFFNDSTLTYNKKWIIEFLQEYKKKIKIPFSINVVIPEINDEVGAALKDNGYCELVRFGLETGNEDFRKNILNKKISNEKLLKGAKMLQKYGIRYSMQMMLGLPGETLDLAWESIEVAKKLSAKDSVHGINIFKPFPGLEITEYGIKIGQYRKEDLSAWDVSDELKKTKDGNGDFKDLALGTRDMAFYENYRTDPVGEYILRLSRFSHIAIRVPALRPLIKQLIKLPDNFIYRFTWKVTEALLNIRVHANVPLSFFVKYFLFHSGKRIR